jgi:hypothetical protein
VRGLELDSDVIIKHYGVLTDIMITLSTGGGYLLAACFNLIFGWAGYRLSLEQILSLEQRRGVYKQ